MDTKQCPKCGAQWINGQHFWATGKEGDPHDLAGLVCNKFGDDTCINPCKGSTSGVTWDDRLKGMDSLDRDLNKVNEQL